jgi:hypothetical protein
MEILSRNIGECWCCIILGVASGRGSIAARNIVIRRGIERSKKFGIPRRTAKTAGNIIFRESIGTSVNAGISIGIGNRRIKSIIVNIGIRVVGIMVDSKLTNIK